MLHVSVSQERREDLCFHVTYNCKKVQFEKFLKLF